MAAPAARGDDGVHPRAIQHGADAVAVAREQPRQHGHEFGRHLRLRWSPEPKSIRRAQVQQEPGGHLAVFGEHAHMRHLHAGGHVPVDVAHVVVVLVLAQVGQVQAGAAHQRAVVALQQAVQPADDRPFQPAQHLFGAAARNVAGPAAGVRWRFFGGALAAKRALPADHVRP
jgi:hypothetical protein